MKTATLTTSDPPRPIVKRIAPPRMTRQLAEKRAVGDVKALKFDGTTFLRTLKK